MNKPPRGRKGAHPRHCGVQQNVVKITPSVVLESIASHVHEALAVVAQAAFVLVPGQSPFSHTNPIAFGPGQSSGFGAQVELPGDHWKQHQVVPASLAAALVHPTGLLPASSTPPGELMGGAPAGHSV
jgi:hypothetical protein